MYCKKPTFLEFINLKQIAFGLFVNLCIIFGLNAQTNIIKFDHLTVDNGLSNNTVKSLLRDSKGYLWIGTGHGLNRYDGDKLKVFENSDSNPYSLSNNYVNTLLEDKENNLWVGTAAGLSLFDRKTERFKRFMNNAADSKSISNNAINSIISDSRGTIWIATLYGLNHYVKDQQNFERFFPGPKEQKDINNITDLCVDKSGLIWLATSTNQLCCFNPSTKKTVSYTVPMSSTWKALSCLAVDAKGNIWVGSTDDGLFQFDTQLKIFTKIPVSFNGKGINGLNVKDLFFEDATHLLIGINSGGLNRLNIETKTFEYYLNNQNDLNSLSSNGVWTTYKDEEGILYVGTFNGGLNIFNPKKGRFKTYSHNPKDPGSLSGNLVFRFFEDSYGLIWIGTDEGGLCVFNPKLNTMKTYKNNPRNPYSISGNSIFCIKEDKNHDIWVGTWANGLNRLDRKSGKFYRYYSKINDLSSLPSNNIFDIQPTDNGRIWVATYSKGVALFDPRKGVIKRFTKDANNKNSISENTTRLIKNSSPHKLGFVTLNGYCEFDSIHNSFSTIKELDGVPLYDIYRDNRGNLWAATQEKGLWVINKNGDVKKYLKENGLPSNAIMGIAADRSQNLWILTDRGISKFSPQNASFQNFSVYDGLAGKQFTNNAILVARDGTLYFGGNNGFNTINPATIRPNKTIPPVYIDEFQIFNSTVYPDSANSPLKEVISATKKIELTYKQSVISFGFTAVNMTYPEKALYAYKMDGYDKDWNYTTSERKYVTYTNLDPGEYTFQVKATNNDGVWNETPTSINIVITPPFWKTKLAYFVYLLILIFIVYRIRYSIRRRYEQKNSQEFERLQSEKMKELSEIRLRFFTNISHEFRTPLTLLMGPLTRLIKEASVAEQPEIETQAKLALRNAKELEHLTNQLLDFRKIETKNMKLDLEHGDIVEFLKGIYEKFKLLSESKKIVFELIQKGKNENAYFDADKIEKICNNLLSNAFKFTPENGKVTFKVEAIGSTHIQISVSDTGKGISPEHLKQIFNPFYQVPELNTHTNAGTGIGLALCKELIELHRGTILVESNVGNGSCFTIKFPVSKESFDYDSEVPELNISQAAKLQQETFEQFESVQSRLSNHFADEKSPLILIVEDHAELRDYVKDILNPFYRVITAKNGRAGFENAIQDIPDLIITDVMMPEMNGVEMTAKLKKDIRTSHIPVIMLTALSSDENKIKGFYTGADDYITKPFNHELLLLKLKNLFDLRQKWREYYKSNFGDTKSTELVEPQSYLVNSELDDKFIKRCHQLVIDHLSDSDFEVDQFASEIGVSVSVLYLKMKALIGQTPAEIVRDYRMKKAAELLRQKQMTISEIAFEVGFKDPKHFSKNFKKHHGVSPSQFE